MVSFGTKFKEKVLGRIFFFKCSVKRVFFVASDVVSTINLVYVPEINIFASDGIIQI